MNVPTPQQSQQVILRSGMLARVWTHPPQLTAEPFVVLGLTDHGELHAWRRNGTWSYDETEHPLDIKYVVTPQGPVALSSL